MPFRFATGIYKFCAIVFSTWLTISPAFGAAEVTAERLAVASRDSSNWYTLGRDTQQSYYSPLSSIDSNTVQRLGYAWSYDLGTARGQEANPLVVDGVMYTSGVFGVVYAVDADTGKEKWRFLPSLNNQSIRNPCCDAVNRGVALWHGRIYVAAVDGVLYALDAKTGKQIWAADSIADHSFSYSSTGAPIIAHNVVVIGNSGGDMDKGGVRGYVSAYDLNTGTRRWRFYTVPKPKPGPLEPLEMQLAAKSWASNRDRTFQGGATAWDGMSYDPELNLLYFGTGNAAPYDVRKLGPNNGDMLFACSILAVDADTGKMAWYYQTTPADRWDFDSTQKLILADLDIQGRKRQVLMQANKNGYFYVLDRRTGELISANNFSYVNWASGVNLRTGRPMLTPQAEYYDKPKNIYPSTVGAHTWPAMSYNPLTKLVYIPVVEMGNILFDMNTSGGRVKYVNGYFTVGAIETDDDYDPKSFIDWFGPAPALGSVAADLRKRPMREVIRAWDPVEQRAVWEQQTSAGVRASDGGVLSTAGNLVIQGHGDGELVVYAADSGKKLKSIQTGSHIMAAPITYAVDGVQYVAVQTGYGGAAIVVGPIPSTSIASRNDNANRIIAFKLDGGDVPQPAVRVDEPFPAPPASHASKAQVELGEIRFAAECSRCHVFGPSVTPDLRKLTPGLHLIFNDIVLNGALASQGMEKFGDLLSEKEVDAIHAYLIDLQRQGYEIQQQRH